MIYNEQPSIHVTRVQQGHQKSMIYESQSLYLIFLQKKKNM